GAVALVFDPHAFVQAHDAAVHRDRSAGGDACAAVVRDQARVHRDAVGGSELVDPGSAEIVSNDRRVERQRAMIRDCADGASTDVVLDAAFGEAKVAFVPNTTTDEEMSITD